MLNILNNDLEILKLKYDFSEGEILRDQTFWYKKNINLTKDQELKIEQLENKLLTERNKKLNLFW